MSGRVVSFPAFPNRQQRETVRARFREITTVARRMFQTNVPASMGHYVINIPGVQLWIGASETRFVAEGFEITVCGGQEVVEDMVFIDGDVDQADYWSENNRPIAFG